MVPGGRGSGMKLQKMLRDDSGGSSLLKHHLRNRQRVKRVVEFCGLLYHQSQLNELRSSTLNSMLIMLSNRCTRLTCLILQTYKSVDDVKASFATVTSRGEALFKNA